MNADDIAAIQDEIANKASERSDAEIQSWLERDTWTAHEGLLLIVGQ